MTTSLLKDLGLQRNYVKKVSPVLFRIAIKGSVSSMLQRLFLQEFVPGWYSTSKTVMMVVHPLRSPEDADAYQRRATMQSKLAAKLPFVARPLACGTLNTTRFIMFLEDSSPKAHPLPKQITPVILAKIERTLLSFWTHGVCFDSFSRSMLFYDPATLRITVPDLSTLVKPTWPTWRRKEYVQVQHDLDRFETLYMTAQHADARFLATLRKTIHSDRNVGLLRKARQYV